MSDKSTLQEIEDLTQVRYGLPPDCMKKIKSRKRKLSAVKDADVSMNDALIDLIRRPKA